MGGMLVGSSKEDRVDQPLDGSCQQTNNALITKD